MSADEPPHKGSTRRTLERFLAMAFPDDKGALALQRAFTSAHRTTLPDAPGELLVFVKTHLVPHLNGVLAPHLIFAMLDDLSSESEVESDRSGMRRVLQTWEATRIPTLPGFAPMKDPTDPPSNVLGRRATIALVDANRFSRASLARALVTARFNVNVFETTEEMQHAIRKDASTTAAILDLSDEDIATRLEELAVFHPTLPILAWTDEPPESTGERLSAAGVRRFAVVPRTAASTDVVDGVRGLLAAS